MRAISQQPTRQLSTLRSFPASRIAVLQSSQSCLSRSFHQSRIWRAEEDKAKDEALSAAEQAEDAAEAAQEAAEDAIVQAAASEAPQSEPAVKQAQEVAEGEASVAAQAAETAAAAFSTAQSAAPAPPSDYPPEPRQRPLENRFPNERIPTIASESGANPPTRILYVGNLFFEVTASQIEAEFAKYGTITNSRIVTDARGLSKGFGYVEFAEQSAADNAVRELDQKVFQGRRMAVQFHVRRERKAAWQRDSRPKPASKTLFIGNMSYQMSDRDLNGKNENSA